MGKMKTVFRNCTLLTLCSLSLAVAWPSFLWSQRHLPSALRSYRHRSMTNPSQDVNKHEKQHQIDVSYIERAPETYITSKLDDEFIKRGSRVHSFVHSEGGPIEGPIFNESTVPKGIHYKGDVIGRDTDSLFYKTPRLGKAIHRNEHHKSERGRSKHKKDEVCQSDGNVKLIPCASNPSRCIREDQVCNNIQDCNEGEDEDPKSCLLKRWVSKLLPKLEQIIQGKKDL